MSTYKGFGFIQILLQDGTAGTITVTANNKDAVLFELDADKGVISFPSLPSGVSRIEVTYPYTGDPKKAKKTADWKRKRFSK